MRNRWWQWLSGLGVALAILLPSMGQAQQFWPVEQITFESRTFSDEEFLAGAADAGEAVTLSAALIRPPDASGKQPIILLLHGTDRPTSNAVTAWRMALGALGYAIVRIDSYTARGISQQMDSPANVSQFAQIYDAFRLIEVLSADERIDPDRFVIMGFSRGGTAALYAGLQRFHDLYGPAEGQIAAYLPFYAACNFELADGLKTTGAPIRAFHGGADDWTSAEDCAAYVEALAAAGADAEITIYPDVAHAFDSPIPTFLMEVEGGQSSIGCMRVEVDGVFVNRDTGAPFSYNDDCVSIGPHVKSDPAAFAAAQNAVAAFLETVVAAP